MAKKKSASDNAASVKPTTKKTPVKDERGFEESLWDSANLDCVKCFIHHIAPHGMAIFVQETR